MYVQCACTVYAYVSIQVTQNSGKTNTGMRQKFVFLLYMRLYQILKMVRTPATNVHTCTGALNADKGQCSLDTYMYIRNTNKVTRNFQLQIDAGKQQKTMANLYFHSNLEVFLNSSQKAIPSTVQVL